MFANELEEDAERFAGHAEKLKHGVLWLHRAGVIDMPDNYRVTRRIVRDWHREYAGDDDV